MAFTNACSGQLPTADKTLSKAKKTGKQPTLSADVFCNGRSILNMQKQDDRGKFQDSGVKVAQNGEQIPAAKTFVFRRLQFCSVTQ